MRRPAPAVEPSARGPAPASAGGPAVRHRVRRGAAEWGCRVSGRGPISPAVRMTRAARRRRARPDVWSARDRGRL